MRIRPSLRWQFDRSGGKVRVNGEAARAMSHDAAAVSRTSPRAYFVWGVGVFAFIVTVLQRTTIGVSGLEATQRFSITAASLSLFAFAQVLAYVLVQIPAGVLVDRRGSRVMGVVSCLVAAGGQLLLAVTTNLAAAIAARVVVGIGDALILIVVLALIPRWFPHRSVPLITQMTVILAQLGQILSAVPFLWLLHQRGWTTAFSAAAALSVLAAVVVAVSVRNGPPGAQPVRAERASLRAVAGQIGLVWRRPGTKLGYFGHTATQFSGMVFCLLWGFPYLVSAQGLQPAAASRMLTALVVCAAVVAPLMGVLTARHPMRRSWLLMGTALLTMGVWTVVLALRAPAPAWLLYLLMAVLACGGPASVVSLDIARTHNPSASLAVAQSIANVGGFGATVVVMLAMGVLLDRAGGFTFDAFRLAWLAQYPSWILGLIGIVVARRKARRLRSEHDAAAHPDGVPAAR